MAIPFSILALLAIPTVSPSKLKAQSGTQIKKRQAIAEAIAWPSGQSVDKQTLHTIFRHGPYEVCLAKPGKETLRTGDKHNPNDMLPCVLKEGEKLQFRAAFGDIFKELQRFEVGGAEILELVGCLLVRAAFMVDHIETTPGVWRYSPPAEVIEYIEEHTPGAGALPLQILLQFLNALAWNEDVKYFTRGYDLDSSVGRENTLLTCALFITVPLGRIPFAEVADSFVRGRGVAPLSLRQALDVFPTLAGGTGRTYP